MEIVRSSAGVGDEEGETSKWEVQLPVERRPTQDMMCMIVVNFSVVALRARLRVL